MRILQIHDSKWCERWLRSAVTNSDHLVDFSLSSMCGRFFRLAELLFVIFTFTLLLRDTDELFFGQSDVPNSRKKSCCVPPKINIDSKKANRGREFLERLATESKTVTPDDICHWMHFLFQQATINPKPAPPGRSYPVETSRFRYVPSCSLQPDSGRFFARRIPVCSGAFQCFPTRKSSEFVRRKTGRNPVARNHDGT